MASRKHQILHQDSSEIWEPERPKIWWSEGLKYDSHIERKYDIEIGLKDGRQKGQA
jgi:hypothetical protein